MSTPNKQRKKKASTNAIREIKKEQKKTNLIIPSAPFNRLVQEISKNQNKGNLRIKADAYNTLQHAAENHLIGIFQKSNKCAIASGRETIQTKDIQLVSSLEQASI